MAKFQIVVDAMLEPIMDRYLELREEELGQTEEAIAAGDSEAVRMLGHRLKGSGTSYGFVRLTELGADLEAAAKEDDLVQAGKLAAEVRAYLDNVEVVFEEMDE